jgi:hypothetical protein
MTRGTEGGRGLESGLDRFKAHNPVLMEPYAFGNLVIDRLLHPLGGGDTAAHFTNLSSLL